MHLTTALDELTEADLLDHADEVSRQQRECEVQVLRIAVQVAILNNPQRLDHEISRLPGRERSRRFGGIGTPEVTEFAAATLGARLGISTGSAHSLMADALDLMIRLPQLWRRVEVLEVKASDARFVARRTRDLSLDQASYVDERSAESADVLASLGDADDLDARRVKAVAILADPLQAVALMDAFARWRANDEAGDPPEIVWPAIMPGVTLHVHTYAGSEPTGTARAEGHGPITEDWVREHLGRHVHFTIRPVVDLAGQAPVDAYEIPDRHREAVHLMTPADTFPWGVNTDRRQQVDHTEALRHRGPPGQSRVGNYGPMTTFSHHIKTHDAWQVRQPFPGIDLWRDPYGATYLIDHTGTRRLRSGPTMTRAEAHVTRALFELTA